MFIYKRLKICLLLFSLSGFCHAQNPKGYCIINESPTFLKDGKVIKYTKDTVRIIAWDSMALYQFAKTYIVSEDTTIVSSTVRPSYYIYKSGSNSGFFFDIDEDSISARPMVVDSMFLQQFPKIISSLIQNNDLKLIKKTVLAAGSFREDYEVYPKNKQYKVSASCQLYYADKLKDLDFSFSRQFDSLSNSKLVGIKLKAGKIIDDKSKIIQDSFYVSIMLSEMDPLVNEEIIACITKFKSLVQ